MELITLIDITSILKVWIAIMLVLLVFSVWKVSKEIENRRHK